MEVESKIMGAYGLNGEYGEFTKLITLQVGTKFYVRNGCWYGEIVDVNGEKCLHVIDTDKTYVISEDDEQAIDILNIEIVKAREIKN